MCLLGGRRFVSFLILVSDISTLIDGESNMWILDLPLISVRILFILITRNPHGQSY